MSDTPYLDAHGFDPDAYDWVPVRRRPRHDGWSEQRQRSFIEVLADTACAETAARAVGMTVQSAYALRRSPGGEAFASAWAAAVHQGRLRLVDEAYRRAIHGSDEPVYDRSGICIGRRRRQSDRLLMFLMRAHLPEVYAAAHRAERPADLPPPPEALPIGEAIARLAPAPIEAPHALLPPHQLDIDIQTADILEGRLPHWRRDPADTPPAETDYSRAFERRLAEARAAEHLPDDEDDPDEPPVAPRPPRGMSF